MDALTPPHELSLLEHLLHLGLLSRLIPESGRELEDAGLRVSVRPTTSGIAPQTG